jgi:hypothetical protein
MAIKIKKNKAYFRMLCSFNKFYGLAILITYFLAASYNPAGAKAQNISRYYTSYQQQNGMLYYIFPLRNFSSFNSRNDFLFDITYSTEKDSVILNFSFLSKQTLFILGLTLEKISSPAKKIYIDFKKNKWFYRYSCMFSFEDIKSFFSKKEKPTIFLITEQQNIEITTSAKNWKKISAALSKIFIVVEQNKK